jgi:hypothetical protein
MKRFLWYVTSSGVVAAGAVGVTIVFTLIRKTANAIRS